MDSLLLLFRKEASSKSVFDLSSQTPAAIELRVRCHAELDVQPAAVNAQICGKRIRAVTERTAASGDGEFEGEAAEA